MSFSLTIDLQGIFPSAMICHSEKSLYPLASKAIG
nr:MAG TPA: hypothetical protein [Caudoviricetes sp.]